MNLKLEPIANKEFKVFVGENTYLGKFYRESDGYYCYEPLLRPGYWPSELIRAIANKLDELNEPWHKEIQEFFENQ